MPSNLSIKNVPDEILDRLRRRANRHHRSLQGELMTMLEQGVLSEPRLTVDEVLTELRRLGLRTPSEAADMVRTDRNAHQGH